MSEHFPDRPLSQKEKFLASLAGLVTEARNIPHAEFSVLEEGYTHPVLHILCEAENNSAEVHDIYKQLGELLKKHEMEIGGNISGSKGGKFQTLIIHPTKIDGAVNWRRWVHFPDQIDKGAQIIFDKIVRERPDLALKAEQHGWDSFQKFCFLQDLAYKEGFITTDELKLLEDQSYAASHIRSSKDSGS